MQNHCFNEKEKRMAPKTVALISGLMLMIGMNASFAGCHLNKKLSGYTPFIANVGEACRSASNENLCNLLYYNGQGTAVCQWKSSSCVLQVNNASKHLLNWDPELSKIAVLCATQKTSVSCTKKVDAQGKLLCSWLDNDL